MIMREKNSFGTIRNNIALKPSQVKMVHMLGFGTIRNNIALKRMYQMTAHFYCFGTIRNNIALKLCLSGLLTTQLFWDHSKQHSSKTS